jgi:exocyst complex component 4
MFRFSDTDNRLVANDIKPIDEALQRSLKSSVPGLVHMQSVDGGSTQQSILQGVTSGSDNRFTSTSKHRLLIPPNAFNVSTLFQPTLAFVQRASSIAPPGLEDETGAFSSVLEDFVVKVFLPQLDERVTASFQQAVSGVSTTRVVCDRTDDVGYDAYQLDRAMPFTERPPLKVR